MALLNMLYGDPAGGFGRREVKLGSAVVTLNPSPMPKAKKSGKRTSARCAACGEVSSPCCVSAIRPNSSGRVLHEDLGSSAGYIDAQKHTA